MKKMIAFTVTLAAGVVLISGMGNSSTSAQSIEKQKTVAGANFLSNNANSDWHPTIIQDRMLNSIDNFSTIQGSFHQIDKVMNVDKTVNFIVHEGSNPGSYTQVIRNNDGTIVEEQSDGGNILEYDHREGTYINNKISKEKLDYDTQNFKSRKMTRELKAADGNVVYAYRMDPAGATNAQDVAFPQAFAFWLDTKYQAKVVGEDRYLGRDVTILAGKFDDFMSKKQQASDFKMWIDSQTGVLMKLIETNQSGEVVNQIEVTDIKFDQQVDTSKFVIKTPQGAKDVTFRNNQAK